MVDIAKYNGKAVADIAKLDSKAVADITEVNNLVRPVGNSDIRSIYSVSYTGNSFVTSTNETTPESMTIEDDGTKLYVVGQQQNGALQYTLSTPYDISTASYVRTKNESRNLVDIHFKPDGTKMYTLGIDDDDIYEYDLSTAWDISTASYSDFFSTTTQDATAQGMYISPDGTKVYVTGDSGDEVNEYTMSTARDLTTISYTATGSISGQDSAPRGIEFSTDGDKMFLVGDINNKIYQYSLTTARDITTLSYDSINYNLANQATEFGGLDIKDNNIYIMDTANDTIFQYEMIDGGAPTTNLIHEWLMDGDLLDTSGSKDLTGTNITFATPSGVLQDVAVFDTTAYTDDTNISALGKTQNYTVSIVFKMDVNTDIALLCNTNGSTDRLAIVQRSSGNLCIGQYTGSWTTKSGAFTDTTTHHHLIVTHTSGGVMTVTLDGVSLTGSTNPFSVSTVGFNIGSRTNNDSNRDGNVCRGRIYNAVLSAGDQTALYDDAKYRTDTP